MCSVGRSYVTGPMELEEDSRIIQKPVQRTLKTIVVGVACIGSILCIVQFWWIRSLASISTRNAEDNFVSSFSTLQGVHWASPAIWDTVRQAEIGQVMPVAVHSHNDYLRKIPLWEALGSGCISIEADVHFVKSDLLVGHSSRSLKRKNTLSAMYLEPLRRLIDSRNINNTSGPLQGVFEKVPQQTLVLLIDLKDGSQKTLEKLSKQLETLRSLDYLTHWNGTSRVMRPLTIVASGKARFDDIQAVDPGHRDIFFDAPLASLHDSSTDDWTTSPPTYAYNISNSYYASGELKTAVISLASSSKTSLQEQDASASQPDQARSRGLISRYWGSAGTKYQTSEEVMWRYFVEIGIGIINMDDMAAVRDRTRGMGKMTIQG
ncbi:hypothetical protein KCU93_g8952, partial [Aureobasidium melanogenum]